MQRSKQRPFGALAPRRFQSWRRGRNVETHSATCQNHSIYLIPGDGVRYERDPKAKKPTHMLVLLPQIEPRARGAAAGHLEA